MYGCDKCNLTFFGPLSFAEHKLENGECVEYEHLRERNLIPFIKGYGTFGTAKTAKHGIKFKVKREIWGLKEVPRLYGPQRSPRIFNSKRRYA